MIIITAYTLGLQAQRNGLGYNLNPFDPECEIYQYDSWMDGWVMGANGMPSCSCVAA